MGSTPLALDAPTGSAPGCTAGVLFCLWSPMINEFVIMGIQARGFHVADPHYNYKELSSASSSAQSITVLVLVVSPPPSSSASADEDKDRGMEDNSRMRSGPSPMSAPAPLAFCLANTRFDENLLSRP